MTKEVLEGLATAYATKYNINGNLFKSIISTESSWNPNVCKHEDGYKYLVSDPDVCRPLKITQETDLALQKFSYGLVQIMGAVARELGFSGYMQELFIPETNLSYGAVLVQRLSMKYKNNINDIAASYNAGSPRRKSDGTYENQSYVDRINEFYERYSNGTT